MRRVVITGMGIVSPIGVGIPAFRQALREGRSGIGPITRFEPDGLRARSAFEVKNFTPLRGTHLLDPFIQYALYAAEEARASARFDLEAVDPYRVGVAVSSSKGGMHSFQALWKRFVERPTALLAARLYANFPPNRAAEWIARRFRIKGPALCYVTACATGTTSIIEGARMIQEGAADYVFAGASDASIVPFLAAGYEQMRVLSPDGMLPFDRRRKGFVLGEGAGVVFLESLESARARRVPIKAEVIGFAYGTESSHPLAFDPEAEALARTLRNLFQKNRLSPSEIDYVNLHGTATEAGDLYETDQIKRAFGRQAYRLATSSTKSMVGHMLGGAGAVEVIASSIALGDGFIPPTVGLEKPDPRCDLDYTAGRAREKKISTAVSISMGFGGHIAAVALRKV